MICKHTCVLQTATVAWNIVRIYLKKQIFAVWQQNFEPSPLSNSAESLGCCALAVNNLEFGQQTIKKTGSAVMTSDSILLGTRSAQSDGHSCFGGRKNNCSWCNHHIIE